MGPLHFFLMSPNGLDMDNDSPPFEKGGQGGVMKIIKKLVLN
jgi:hypothetical protein